VEKFVHVVYDEANSIVQGNSLEDEDAGFQDKDSSPEDETKVDKLEQSNEITAKPPKYISREWRTQKDLSLDNIIGEILKGVSTHSRLGILCNNMAFFSQTEPRNIDKVLYDEYWLMAMHEELNQFKRKEAVWDLVPKPAPHKLIKTKWVFRNKLDESSILVRNKARLVAKGYNL